MLAGKLRAVDAMSELAQGLGRQPPTLYGAPWESFNGRPPPCHGTAASRAGHTRWCAVAVSRRDAEVQVLFTRHLHPPKLP
ncbi:MAG: hypothetical protein ABI895_32755, partial [Deltaproteobacteria bacterium]